MNLDDEKKKQVSAWIAGGAKLSDIQSRLDKEFGLRLTYMEVRFLIDDLKLTPKDIEPPKPAAPLAAPATAATANPADTTAAPKSPAAPPAGESKTRAGGVSVGVDQVTRPGALVSGKVTFSDGQQAEWYLDQLGRLGVVPKQQGYKPTTADVQSFQITLQDELARLGY